ncbi:MAG: acyltransferase [Lachnospiraceae bacterium]|nr:acyltransferase [Lachnospiraceae bacterium]
MKNRILYVDLLRALLCIIILLYHMGLLKGGYLAVCSFFVLSGYLSAQSLRKVDFSVLSYYKSRLLRVYLPLVMVVLVSLAVTMLVFPDITWISMKQEVTSIIFGYNNFWQSSASMDYFARHIDSPYMHLWYIAILLQLELIFPLIYTALEYTKRQISKNTPAIMCLIIVMGSVAYFVYTYKANGLMTSYYNTFARCFSWFAGIAIGYWHVINRTFIIDKIQEKANSKRLIYILIIIQLVLFFLGSADSYLYMIGIIGITMIMCILLDYVKSSEFNLDMEKTPKIVKKVIEFVSNISYEVFLVQYPVIFILDKLGISTVKKYILIIIITFAVAMCFNTALNIHRNTMPLKLVSAVMLVVLIVGTIYGAYRYVISPDLKAEQEELEAEMRILKMEQVKKHIEYEIERETQSENQETHLLAEAILANHNDIDSQIAAIENEISRVNQMVVTLRITFVGDSVLLGASDVLDDYFSKCYIDADIGRTAYALNPILQRLEKRGILGKIVVINCGANGDCPDDIKDEIMYTLRDKEVFWVTTTNDMSANESIKLYAEKHNNLHIIDWCSISYGHSEYFAGDGLHLEYAGKEAYSQAVLDTICNYFIEELEKEKNELEKQKLESDK